MTGHLVEHDVTGCIGPRLPGAQTIDRPRSGHHQEPARHRSAAGLVPGCGTPGLREHLLHDVLGIGLIAEDPPRERQDPGGMTVVQLPRGIHVAGCQPANQAQVRVRGSADSSWLQTRIPCHVLRTGLAIGLGATATRFYPSRNVSERTVALAFTRQRANRANEPALS